MEQKQKQKLNLIKKSKSFKMTIPAIVENKIRYICQQISSIEWSGTLFYTVEGSFEDDNLEIICKDIFPMDIGNNTYTEFSMSPEVISYMTDNIELLDCQMGLIHSHHSMATFFSSTDLNTLLEEGTDRNHFVSLIVNNIGKYSAAITRRIKYSRVVEDNYNYNSFEDISHSNKRTYTLDGSEVEYYPLDIHKEGDDYSGIQARLDSIAEEKKRKSFKDIKSNIVSTSINTPVYKEITNTSKDPELFDWDYIDNKDTYNLYNYQLPKETTHSLAMQILTGCITISESSKLDVNKWISNMEKVFDNRFGKDGENSDLFIAWADSYIETICWYSNSFTTYGIYDDYERSMIVAKNIREYLEKLPKNKYIVEFIRILKTYESK